MCHRNALGATPMTQSQQLSFAYAEYANKGKVTGRESFLID